MNSNQLANCAKFPDSDFLPFLGKVYKPDAGSFLLLQAVAEDMDFIKATVQPNIAVEIGMGSGIVITTIGKCLKPQNNDVNAKPCKIYATDINPIALQATQKCAELNGVQGMELNLCNLADELKVNLAHQVDLLVSNPPFEPAPAEEVGHPSVKSAWAAGPTGRAIIDKLIVKLPQLMSKRGVVYLAMIAENNVKEVIELMLNNGFYHKVMLERSGTTSSTFGRTYNQYVVRFSLPNYDE